jgi:tRNA (mo5U34)-methyltransferase
MDVSSLQRRIDSVTWYHEFDFGRGLRSQSKFGGAYGHRELWAFIEEQLDKVDFRGKSVLDIGCWDGYWSFYAERRGASRVLATDDRTQNWSDGEGIHIARELLGSSVEIDQQVSVYELSSLKQTFDIVLFLGVYYHLFDPFYALAQIRQCCHAGSLLLMEGAVAVHLHPGEVLYDFPDHNCEIMPHPEALRQLARAAYFREAEEAFVDLSGAQAPRERLGWRWRLGACWDVLRGSRIRIQERMNVSGVRPPKTARVRRMFLACTAFEGTNELHAYKPPFGLHRHDDRFRGSADGRPWRRNRDEAGDP